MQKEKQLNCGIKEWRNEKHMKIIGWGEVIFLAIIYLIVIIIAFRDDRPSKDDRKWH